MPCTYYTPEEERQITIENLKALRKELDKVTALLCATCKQIDGRNVGVRINMIPGLSEWWKKHQEDDRKQAENQKRRLALKRVDKERKIQRLKKELKELEKS